MKKIMLAAIPATLSLGLAVTACGEPETEKATQSETAVVDDDNDAPVPVAEPVAEEEPHDESVPHDH